LIVRPLVWFSREVLWKQVDQRAIDGAGVNGAARGARALGWRIAGCRRAGRDLRGGVRHRRAVNHFGGRPADVRPLGPHRAACVAAARRPRRAAPARAAREVRRAGRSLVEFAISVPLWWTFAPDGGMQFVADHTWIAAWAFTSRWGSTAISLFLVLLTTLLMPLSILGSWSYITKREAGFYALLLV